MLRCKHNLRCVEFGVEQIVSIEGKLPWLIFHSAQESTSMKWSVCPISNPSALWPPVDLGVQAWRTIFLGVWKQSQRAAASLHVPCTAQAAVVKKRKWKASCITGARQLHAHMEIACTDLRHLPVEQCRGCMVPRPPDRAGILAGRGMNSGRRTRLLE